VLSYRQFPADLEDLQEVEELPVGVSADGDGRTDLDVIGFTDEDLLGLDWKGGTLSQMSLTSL